VAKKTRQIVKIDEELCNGCGQCVTACAEGALQIIDGKARLVSDTYCDGLGACLGECPMNALSFETREADEFDEDAAMAFVAKTRRPEAATAHNHSAHGHGHGHGGGFACPSARTIDRTQETTSASATATASLPSELRQWPVKLYLVNPKAPYFQDAEILLAADCTAFAFGSFHPDLLRGKTLVTGCPKFDDTQAYLEKLTDILASNNVRGLTVAKMEVPCCSGLVRLAEMAVAASGKHVPVNIVTIGLEGEIKSRCEPSACGCHHE